ncbi:MAG: hypothetical protein FJ100_20770 [Deltaproteobacteria bacterium]|nr:hypothetical protein [Deltaproteobacteria bacterium]
MPNVTLALDDALLQAARRYAQEHDTSLNELIRQQLQQVVAPAQPGWFDDLCGHVAQCGGSSAATAGQWTRDELHERGA